MKKMTKPFFMKSTFIWLMCILFLIPLQVYAQTSKGTLTGVVVSDTGEKLMYATAGIKETQWGATTDANGEFELELPAGSYTLQVSFTGYDSEQRVVLIEAGKTTNVGEVELQPSSEMIGEVVVDGMINKFSKKKSENVARMPLTNLENPQVYTVVPKELFEEQVSVNFRSALMSSPGVANVTLGVGSGGTGLNMYLRGFAVSTGAGAIRNGMATNWVALSDPANLESLEVIKGPSATLFGSTLVSYGGLVNRVTKKAYNGTGGEIGISTGSYGLGRVTLDYNTPLNEDKTLLFRLNTAVHREKSFQDYGQNKTLMFAPTFTYKASDRLTFDVDIEYFQSERTTTYVRLTSDETISNLEDLNWDFTKSYTSNEFMSSSKILNTMMKATYEMSDKWESQTAFSYSNSDNNANYLFLLVGNTETLTRRPMNIPSLFSTLQFQQNFIGKFKLGSMDNKLLLGVDFTELKTTDTRSYTNYDQVDINSDDTELDAEAVMDALAEGGVNFRNKRSQRTYSAYASDVINFTDKLIAMASLRVDHHRNILEDYNQTALSPKLGLVYQVVKDKVSLFGNFMNGFTNVAPGYTSAEQTELEEFKPEHANQFEAGIKFELLKNKLNGTISYYDIKVKDKVRSVMDDNFNSYSVQDGTQKSSGVEFDLIANPIEGMHIILGFGFNDSEYTNISEAVDGHRPYSVPEQVGNFWISHRLTGGKFDGLGVGLGGNYSSDYFINDANTITVPGYTKFDGTIFYDQPAFRLALKWNNVTNEQYWMSAYDAEPQLPRTFIANFTMKF